MRDPESLVIVALDARGEISWFSARSNTNVGAVVARMQNNTERIKDPISQRSYDHRGLFVSSAKYGQQWRILAPADTRRH